jgi:hypothetical protein
MFNRQVLPREHTNPEALQSAGRVHKRSRHERCAVLYCYNGQL